MIKTERNCRICTALSQCGFRWTDSLETLLNNVTFISLAQSGNFWSIGHEAPRPLVNHDNGKTFPSSYTFQSIFDFLVPQTVNQRIQHGDHHRLEDRGYLVVAQRTAGSGVRVDEEA